MTGAFNGAKGAIFARGGIVTLLRDDRAGLPWAGYWDLPGGGREDGETAWQCFARETFQETGLVLDRRAVRWRRTCRTHGNPVAFFGVVLPHLDEADLRLGDEGQRIGLMPVGRFLRHPRAIPAFRARVAACRAALATRGVCV